MSQPIVELDIVYHLEDNSIIREDSRIARAAQWVAEQFQLRMLYASIAIVDDDTMRQLNAERLGHDWPTDVISFVIDQNCEGVEGEVIASAETAVEVCISAQWSAQDELLLYVVHGLLHIAGMDDIEPQDRQAMRLKERECLIAMGIPQADQHLQRWDSVFNSQMIENEVDE